jgi:hypothetical protein
LPRGDVASHLALARLVIFQSFVVVQSFVIFQSFVVQSLVLFQSLIHFIVDFVVEVVRHRSAREFIELIVARLANRGRGGFIRATRC